MICGANNEESLRSGLQKCLTSLQFIAAAEELSFLYYQNCLDWLSWESVTEFKIFFSKTQQKKTATQITPTATQFHFRVAETAMQNFDSKFSPAVFCLCIAQNSSDQRSADGCRNEWRRIADRTCAAVVCAVVVFTPIFDFSRAVPPVQLSRFTAEKTRPKCDTNNATV